jgi:hypothetical protein
VEGSTIDAEKAILRALDDGATTVDLGGVDIADRHVAWSTREVDAAQVLKLFLRAVETAQPCCLKGVRVRGSLNLALQSGKVPFVAECCWFDGGIDLDGADLAGVAVKKSRIDRLKTGFAMTGRFTKIGGELELERCVINGSLALASITTAGGIGFAGCHVTATEPSAQTPTGSSDGEWAIDLTNAKTGDMTLKGATVTGGVAIPGAVVSGQLNLREVEICQPHGRLALWAQRATVTESVLANALVSTSDEKAIFVGIVSLHGADVGGSVILANAVFKAPPTPAGTTPPDEGARAGLTMRFAEVTSLLRLNDIGLPDGGKVDLRSCEVGELERTGSVWTKDGVVYEIENLEYGVIDETGQTARTWIQEARGKTPGAYLTLAQAASACGNPKDEKKAKIKASDAAATMIERWVFFGWIRYGYRPLIAAVPLIVLAAVCLLQVMHADNNSAAFAPVKVGDETVTVDACNDAEARCLNPLVYGVDSVLPIDFNQVSTWRPNTDEESGNYLAMLVNINLVVSWLVVGSFLAAVGGLLNRT